MTPARLLRRLVLLEEGEALALLWSALYFFLLLFGFYLLRPVREAIGIARGADCRKKHACRLVAPSDISRQVEPRYRSVGRILGARTSLGLW